MAEQPIMSSDRPRFRAGTNIAVKLPAALHATTVSFYRDTVGLEHLGTEGDSEVFAFGSCRLWLDRVQHATHPETWLELVTDDVDAGATCLRHAGARVADEIEPLEGVDGHWIIDPAGSVVLLARSDA